jgi:hypothetical protein
MPRRINQYQKSLPNEARLETPVSDSRRSSEEAYWMVSKWDSSNSPVSDEDNELRSDSIAF